MIEESCVWCQSVYPDEKSTAKLKNVFCSQRCEEQFHESEKEPLEFI